MSQGSFERDTVPVSFLEGLPNGGATDIETKLTKYLVATLTEEKEAGVLYFAHRSFLEFRFRMPAIFICVDGLIVLGAKFGAERLRTFLLHVHPQRNAER